MNHLYWILKEMTIENCPGCKHPRKSHDGGSCFHLVDAVTAGGEIHPTMCGYCVWEPFVNENGSKGWRNVNGFEPEMLRDDAGRNLIWQLQMDSSPRPGTRAGAHANQADAGPGTRRAGRAHEVRRMTTPLPPYWLGLVTLAGVGIFVVWLLVVVRQ